MALPTKKILTMRLVARVKLDFGLKSGRKDGWGGGCGIFDGRRERCRSAETESEGETFTDALRDTEATDSLPLAYITLSTT
jgi:hypothetical protein